jgi:hypothetical protein
VNSAIERLSQAEQDGRVGKLNKPLFKGSTQCVQIEVSNSRQGLLRENQTMLKNILLAAALVATANAAFASDAPSTNAQSQQTQAQTGKTRAQVYQELVQAEQDGTLAELGATLYRGGM